MPERKRNMTLRPLHLIFCAGLLFTAGCGPLFTIRKAMYDQPKYEPLEATDFFGDRRSARPLIEGPPSYPTQVTNIQIALDTSGSMNEPFGSRIREEGNLFTSFDAAMDVINQFTRNRQGDAFGLSIFTAKVIHWVPLTTDLSAIRLATPFCPPWSVSAGVVGPNAGWQRDCVLLRTAESAERR